MLLRYAHLCCGSLAKKMDGVAAERTTKDYVHRGRRRRVETLVPVLQSKAKASASLEQPKSPLPENVISLLDHVSSRALSRHSG